MDISKRSLLKHTYCIIYTTNNKAYKKIVPDKENKKIRALARIITLMSVTQKKKKLECLFFIISLDKH